MSSDIETSISITLIAIAIIVVVCLLYYFQENDVEYSITLLDGEIPEGNNITVFFNVAVGDFESPIKSFHYNAWIENNKLIRTNVSIFDYEIFVNSNSDDSLEYEFDTSHLEPGDYTVYTTLKTNLHDGSMYIKRLSLEFEIYGVINY